MLPAIFCRDVASLDRNDREPRRAGPPARSPRQRGRGQLARARGP